MPSGKRQAKPIENRWLAFASRRPFLVSALGAAFLWLAFPPVGIWPLAWLSLIPWILIVAVDQFSAVKPWRKIWLGGLIYWAASLYFIPIPHWALWFGWVALSLYLSLYPLLFISSARVLVHRCRWPIWLAAPSSFVALEWVRAHMISGFSFLQLSHTQYQQVEIIQIVSLFGGYGLTFVMVLVSGLLLAAIIQSHASRRAIAVAAAVLVLAGVYGFGRSQTKSHGSRESQNPSLQVGIIQGSIDTEFPNSEKEAAEYIKRIATQYHNLHTKALESLNSGSEDSKASQLIIWPEGKWLEMDYLPEAHPDALEPDQQLKLQQSVLDTANFHELHFRGHDPIPMIVGGHTKSVTDDDINYNAALLLGKEGKVSDRYFKNHLVIFGEYVPLENWFPVLGQITPIGKGFASGTEAKAFRIGEFNLTPNICFESTIPHLLRRQINQLARENKEPDVIVNVTDDGWFFGTSLLDLHLACNVFRAVENRKPVLVAANTGFSAHVDPHGRILRQGPRRSTDVIVIEVVKSDYETSLYRTVGDWPWIIVTMVCALFLIVDRFRKSASAS